MKATRRLFPILAAAPLAACASVTPAPVQMALCPPPQPRGDLLGEGTGARRALIPSRWGQMHVWVQGGTDFTAKPALLCLHMMPFSGAFFRPFLAEMAKDRLVLAPDMPGCGLSDGPPEPVPMATYADAMLELINLTSIARVDVVGFHTGAALGAALAAHAGAPTVRKLVLAGYPLFESPEAEQRRAAAKPLDLSTPEAIATRWKALDAFLTGYSADRKRELIAASLAAGPNMHWPTLAVLDQNTAALGRAIKQPILMPVLDEMLAAHTRKASALLPTARLKETPQLKSDAWENAAPALAQLTREFLD
jgi:pimeloyl-ACP methyl ester carboxylesterase